jgi:hypothetical protein
MSARHYLGLLEEVGPYLLCSRQLKGGPISAASPARTNPSHSSKPGLQSAKDSLEVNFKTSRSLNFFRVQLHRTPKAEALNKMSNPESRFTAQNKTTQERLSSNTVGLVALSDFRKRRAEVLEQQEREAREAASSTGGTPTIATPDRSQTGTPDPNASDASSHPVRKKTKKRRTGGAKLSFADDDDDEETEGGKSDSGAAGSGKENTLDGGEKKKKFKANASVAIVPRAMTKSVLRREAVEREVLRREFLTRQEAVKATEIAVPFVFYDGTNIPGGTVRVKKGDFIWVFLDKSRKVGAEMGVGEKANAQREWARVGVDDLMMVRANVIIPHVSTCLSFPTICLDAMKVSLWRIVNGKTNSITAL